MGVTSRTHLLAQTSIEHPEKIAVIDDVCSLLDDGKWHTLDEMAKEVGLSPISVGFVLSFLRKYEFIEMSMKDEGKVRITKGMPRLKVAMYILKALLEREPMSGSQKPKIELREEKALGYRLEPSESYIVLSEEPVRAFEMFEENLLNGWQGLCITRQHPKQVRKRYNLEKARLFWLTELEGQNTVNDLAEISLLIEGFVSSPRSGIVLLDGLEYLVSRYGFKAVYHFVQNKRSQTAATESIMVVPMHPKALQEEELALLKRELKPL